MKNVEQFYIEETDYSNLANVKKNNVTKYGNRIKNKYDTKGIENKTKELIIPIKEKFKILEESIRNDLRFSNFKIGRSSIRPNGFRFNSYYWIWMVNKSEYDKLKPKRKSPQLSLPQIQISIHPEGFTSAEIWFEKKAYEKRIEFYKCFKTRIDVLKGEFNILLLKDYGNYKKDVLTTEDGKNTHRNVMSQFKDKNKYPEAGIRITISKEKSIKLGESIIDTIKNDLFKLIKIIYAPVFGDILEYQLESILNNDKLRNCDDVLRKGTESIAYERRHAKMQNVFKEYCEKRGLKVHIEKKRIDAILIRDNYVEIIEMKPFENVKKTIREALGQIIGYNYIYEKINKNMIHLVISGTGKPSKSDIKYINYLKQNIKFDLKYLEFDYRNKNVKLEYY